MLKKMLARLGERTLASEQNQGEGADWRRLRRLASLAELTGYQEHYSSE